MSTHKIADHTQTICRQIADKLSVFDYFVGLELKGLKLTAATCGVSIVNFENNVHNILYINIAFISECLFNSKELLPE